ncbi:hypothetical protein N7457_000055 [Penicillium paradoxum]|uniref:uncharacterized protein n=1 Tax=Penicillium paradoxum TaxID=176176 RepID=UPI002546ABA2|nr:uncharacterized protein N7457_000055 [Penicillium paradoxum]KAJ5793456.1 hypothetical protein N7457_000055 [Penicillium paradoxum]
MNTTTLAIRPKKSVPNSTYSVYIVSHQFDLSYPQSDLAIFVQTQKASTLGKRGDVYFLASDSKGAAGVCLWREYITFSETGPMNDNPMSIGTTSTSYHPEIWDRTLRKLVANEFDRHDATTWALQGSTLGGLLTLDISRWVEKAKVSLEAAGLLRPLPCTSLDFPDGGGALSIVVTI